MQKQTLLVVGGGAAGFFCAVNAARLNPNIKVVLAEKTGKILSKVKVSGGGRCNVTHACFDIATMSANYPRGQHFVKKSFYRFFTQDTINWFKERGVELKTEDDGRMFPVSNSSQTIIDCLTREAEKYNVDIRLHHEVKKISVLDEPGAVPENRFSIDFANGMQIDADCICIACGGYPKMPMFNWLQELGHSIVEPVPSLFTFNLPGNSISSLTGVSLPSATVKLAGTKFSETRPLLITHWGLSGPAVLRLSARAARDLAATEYNFSIMVNWLGEELNFEMVRELLQQIRSEKGKQRVHSKSPLPIPQRLWNYLIAEAGVSENTNWADLNSTQQNRIVELLTAHRFNVQGKTTFKEEFVTCGGITLSEVDPQTMQSKKLKGLFFAGEVLDVDGVTGGFNFQHAWTSGFIAASAIAEMKR